MSERVHRPRSVLLTGGCGFIGSNLVHYLLAEDPEVRLVDLDLLTYAGDPRNLDGICDPDRHTLVVGDICDRALVDRLFAEHDIDTVLHLAAESHVDRSITGSSAFMRTNIEGTYTLLQAAHQAWAGKSGRRFHHVSTDEVYGDLHPGDPAFTEQTPYAPSSPYSASKASSDHLVRAWGRTYALPVTISNCSNNYGPRQHTEKLIPVVIRSCIERRPIPVYGRGANIRDWLHVKDHCAALWHIVQHAPTGSTHNIGSDNEWTNLDLVRKICTLTASVVGCPDDELLALITFVTDRPGHDLRYAIDSTKLRALGWQAPTNFDEGLLETIRWYASRPSDAP
jgi:dTDP-glucose 4,6-dehydratase